jgi:hypothetical protein
MIFSENRYHLRVKPEGMLFGIGALPPSFRQKPGDGGAQFFHAGALM